MRPLPLSTLALSWLLTCVAGCLVPIPLEQQNPTDGGQILMITGAMPPFGTQRPMTTLTQFQPQVDFISDSPNVRARLYLQVNGSCCDLNLDARNALYLLQGDPPLQIQADSNRYSITFSKQPPCQYAMPQSINYLVPVLATLGFAEDNLNADGLGVVDRSHYWTFFCP